MEKNFDLACVGSTTIDVGYLPQQVGLLSPHRWNAILSGSAMISAAATALADREYCLRIAAVTTVGRGVDDPLHDHVRWSIADRCGIEIFSENHARMPISVYEPPGFNKFNIVQERDPQFMLNPLAVPDIEEVRPVVAIFSGGPTTFAGTRDNLLTLAEGWKAEGTLIIIDMNPRSPVDAETAALWVKASHIVKVGYLEMERNFYAETGSDAEEVIRQFINQGAQLVCYTKGRDGCQIYRKNKRPLNIPSQDPLDEIPLPLGGGDAYKAGLALALIENDITAKRSNDVFKNPEALRDLGRRSNDVATLYLRARNGLEVPQWAVARAEAICRPAMTHTTPEQIVRTTYPHSTRDFTFGAHHG